MEGVTASDNDLQLRALRGGLPLPAGAPLAGQTALDRLMASVGPLDRLVSPSTYTVREGDTLSLIAEMLGTDVATMARSNGIPDPEQIKPGQVLRLAATMAGDDLHIAQRGETLDGIARATGTSWQAVAPLDGPADRDRIVPGRG
jgi:hypothetical protein